MKNSCYSVVHQYDPANLEIAEIAITNPKHRVNSAQIRPRHTNFLESQSHRGFKNHHLEERTQPKVCQINSFIEQQEISLAVDILKYQMSDQLTQQNHFNNVRRNLEKRLQSAKANNNETLIDLLEKEFQQLESQV
jgi:molecular chaperone GrpE (heat shock protein)